MREYYLLYVDEAGIVCNYHSPAENIEDSLKNFYKKNRHRKYKVDRIIDCDNRILCPQMVITITETQIEEARKWI